MDVNFVIDSLLICVIFSTETVHFKVLEEQIVDKLFNDAVSEHQGVGWVELKTILDSTIPDSKFCSINFLLC